VAATRARIQRPHSLARAGWSVDESLEEAARGGQAGSRPGRSVLVVASPLSAAVA
jgi:hypothetical protein